MFVIDWLWNNLKALSIYLINIPGKTINGCRVLIARVCWSVIKITGKTIKNNYEGYPDLCPTDNAKNVEPYIEKLNDLLVNRRETVLEIAITAPYSGGKSSLINTFLRRYPYLKHTSISLASFKNISETVGVESKNENSTQTVNPNGTINSSPNENDNLSKIEKSIVQQLLYRTDSSKAPNSRFRRIFPVPITLFQAYFFVTTIFTWLGLISIAIYLPKFSPNLVLESILTLPNIENPYLWLVSYFIALPLLISKDIYRHIGKLNLIKFNPMKGEVAFDQQKKDSIFNIYLEEIIYYFATQKSDVVIFEDIDRFKEPDIFIKLKELNKLINDSKDVRQKVRFIYALRDNVFKGKDRTKFFDAIIPVIPIANKSNSYPQLKQLIHDANDSLEESLDESFLRDISVYVDDMRMLKNIVAEFGIYKNILKPSFLKLDLQKLFAFIIYKNIYCDDFSLLHSGEGMLATFFKSENNFKKTREKILLESISAIEKALIDSDRELTGSLEELNSYYILQILDKIASNGIMIINDKPIKEIAKPDVFESMLKVSTRLNYRNQSTGGNSGSNNTFRQWIEEIVPNYTVRKERINNKCLEVRTSLNNELNVLKDDLESFRGLSVKDLLNKIPKNELFKDVNNKILMKIKDENLLMHLLEKGYVDKYYHLYITHFHEGYMTNNDMDYVMLVKNKGDMDREKSITNPKETLEYFSEDEYRTTSFFNYDIINHLININNTRPLISMVESIFKDTSKNYDIVNESFEIIENKAVWLNIIHNKWDSFWLDIISSTKLTTSIKNSILINSILAIEYKASKELFDQHNKQLESYFSANESICSSIPDDENERGRFFKLLIKLDVKFQLLEESDKNDNFIEQVLKYQLFVIDFENLKVITSFCLKGSANDNDIDVYSYSGLNSIENIDFKRLFKEKENEIVDLAIDNIISLNDEDVMKIFTNDKIDNDRKFNVIDAISFSIKKLDTFGKDSVLLPGIIEKKKFAPNWTNLNFILELGKDYTEIISTFMDRHVNTLTDKENITDKNQLQRYKYILSTEFISVDSFAKYVGAHDIDYPCNELDSIPSDKLKYLIENKGLDIDFVIYAELKGIEEELSSLYAIIEFDSFIEGKLIVNGFITETSEFNRLLESEKLTLENKKLLIEQRESLIDNDNIPGYLIEALKSYPIQDKYRSISSIPKLSASILSSLLSSINQYETKILIGIGQLQYLDEDETKDITRAIDGEVKEIIDAPSYVTLSFSRENECFLEGLKHFGLFISSWSVRKDMLGNPLSIKVNVKRK
jgi:hypothetical protein